MVKYYHEIRDPIHSFIRFDSDERKIVDSRPFQRLRYIHQLAMTYLVYPGATHKRFEHSLGVMELATRVYDVITSVENIHDGVKNLFPQLVSNDKKSYWRRVLRVAALCHDMGHLPFSHAAEKDLLPKGWDHERLTICIIQADEIKRICENMTPPLKIAHVIKLAVGPKKLKGTDFSPWEMILSEIIVGDAFGVDRMDYLLRDSYHAGVAYGKFDHYRLIDTLRILPTEVDEGFTVASLGMEKGGLHCAEALLLARYFMYMQLYFHPVRRIYDIHLKDFLKDWLETKFFATDVKSHINLTDNDVLHEIARATREVAPGSDWAKRIISRGHYRVLYQRNPSDVIKNPESALQIYKAACEKFGKRNIRYDKRFEEGKTLDFPVLTRDKRIIPATLLSSVIQNLPVVAIEFIFVKPNIFEKADIWLKENRESIISLKGEG